MECYRYKIMYSINNDFIFFLCVLGVSALDYNINNCSDA